VRKDRRGPDEIERRIRERERWALPILEYVERRDKVRFQPPDARRVDVAPPKLSLLGLREEVAQNTPGPTSKVKDPLAAEVPVVREKRSDLLTGRATEPIEEPGAVRTVV
jgi:hypothetical protein